MFDSSLTPYIPSELVKLTDYHRFCMYRVWFAVRDRQEEAVIYGKPKSELFKNADDVIGIPHFQEWIWKIIKEGLIKGRELAYTLDASADKVEVPRQFWLSSYADDSLKRGRIDKIELFAHSGEVFVSAEDITPVLDFIYNSLYEQTSIGDNGDLIFSSNPSVIPEIENKGSISKETFDRDLFYQILLCELYSKGPPDKHRGAQKQFRQKIIQAYVDEGGPGGAPSHSWAKDRVRPILRRLKIDNEENGDEPTVPLLPRK